MKLYVARFTWDQSGSDGQFCKKKLTKIEGLRQTFLGDQTQSSNSRNIVDESKEDGMGLEHVMFLTHLEMRDRIKQFHTELNPQKKKLKNRKSEKKRGRKKAMC